jgi:hypothetical protein
MDAAICQPYITYSLRSSLDEEKVQHQYCFFFVRAFSCCAIFLAPQFSGHRPSMMHTSGRVDNENGRVLSRMVAHSRVPRVNFIRKGSVAIQRVFVTNTIAIWWSSSCYASQLQKHVTRPEDPPSLPSRSSFLARSAQFAHPMLSTSIGQSIGPLLPNYTDLCWIVETRGPCLGWGEHATRSGKVASASEQPMPEMKTEKRTT